MRVEVMIRALRLPFVTASVLTSLIAVAWSWAYGSDFNIINALLAVLGAGFLHLGSNVINDFFDTFESDSVNRYPTPFSGGSRVVLENLMSHKQVLILSLVCFLIAGGLGVALALRGRPHVITLGILGFLFGWMYSSKPFQLMSRGFGEIVIFFAFGPVLTLGTGYAIEGRIDPSYFLIGIPMGLIITNILWINEFPDYSADREVGKNNLVVLLGPSSARYGYLLLNIFYAVSIVTLVLMGLYPVWSLISLLTVVFLAKATANLWKNYDEPIKLIPSQATTIQMQALGAILIIAGIIIERLF